MTKPQVAAGSGSDQSGSTARNSITVAGWTVISRMTGLLRVLVIGALMGPTYLANVFQAGYVIPANVFTVMAGPVLAMIVVPVVVGAVSSGGAERAAQVLGRVSGRLLAIAGMCTAVLILLSPLLAWTLVFGVPEPQRGRAWLLTLVLILFVTPQVLLYTIASIGVAAQQGRGRFGLAAAAPSVESIGTIVTVAVAAWMFGTGLDVGQAPMAMMIVLGAGTTGSVALHAGLQVYGAMRAGVFAMPSRGWRRDPQAHDAVRRMFRSVPVAACPVATSFLLTVVAGTVPGGVLVVQLCYQVFYGLSFVGARAVSMAAMPELAEAASTGDGPGFARAWRRCLHYAVVVSLPALFLLVAFAGPTADLLANGELRQAVVIAELAACLLVIAFAQLFGGVHDLGRQALFSRLDDRGPRIAGIVAMVVGIGVGAATLLLPVDGGRLVGLVIAILAAELAAAVVVLSRIRRTLRPEPLIDVRQAGIATVAAVAMLPIIAGGWWLLGTLALGRIVELVLLMGTGLLAVAVFLLVLRSLGRTRPA